MSETSSQLSGTLRFHKEGNIKENVYTFVVITKLFFFNILSIFMNFFSLISIFFIGLEYGQYDMYTNTDEAPGQCGLPSSIKRTFVFWGG